VARPCAVPGVRECPRRGGILRGWRDDYWFLVFCVALLIVLSALKLAGVI
jgi:hypothetical protein